MRAFQAHSWPRFSGYFAANAAYLPPHFRCPKAFLQKILPIVILRLHQMADHFDQHERRKSKGLDVRGPVRIDPGTFSWDDRRLFRPLKGYFRSTSSCCE
jgi:hypothetical protein